MERKPYHQLGVRDRQAVRTAYAAGVPVWVLVAAFGISRQTVWLICREGGLPRRPHRSRWDREGMSASDYIAALRLGVA